jgi:hypothetical protein
MPIVVAISDRSPGTGSGKTNNISLGNKSVSSDSPRRSSELKQQRIEAMEWYSVTTHF